MTSTRLAPRDYCLEPERFGRHDAPTWHLPDGGDQVTLEMAMVQHQASLRIHQQADPTAARRVADRFNFSVKTWSDYTLGKSWMTNRALAAALSLVLEHRAP